MIERVNVSCSRVVYLPLKGNLVCSCDLDPDPMTLIYEFDIDIAKILFKKNELSRSRLSKVRALQSTDRQTDTHTDRCD